LVLEGQELALERVITVVTVLSMGRLQLVEGVEKKVLELPEKLVVLVEELHTNPEMVELLQVGKEIPVERGLLQVLLSGGRVEEVQVQQPQT
jgi:hypothetical protein